MKLIASRLLLISILVLVHGSTSHSFSQTNLVIDGAQTGRVFEGIGGLSAGASTRLLIDYPEPQRSEILDFLFKPNFGASLHHLKVEIGGGINSTDGTEPTHMRSRDDLNFTRGYEWWLMKEAKKRNPGIILDCLPWGAPGWIGNGLYHSEDMIQYIIQFIKGAKAAHDLDIEYTGVWNERYYEIWWIKRLRQALDDAGLEHVKLVAADEYRAWTIVEHLVNDPELRNAVNVIGSHYTDAVPAAALSLDKPIWASEHGSWTGEWRGSSQIAQFLNRNYINGKMTKTINWSLVSSYYNILQLPDSGPMRARQPWSGHYEVQPGIWVIAHTTQFTQPGWTYLEGSASVLLPGGGSIVSLKSPNGRDFTSIVETIRVAQPQTFQLTITNIQSEGTLGPINVWRSTAEEQFVLVDTVTLRNGSFSYTFQPDSIYTLTTLTNGQKGKYLPPAAQPFPLPYREDFEAYKLNATPRYLSDQSGTFEVVARADGQGQALRQMVTHPGIQWNPQFTPYTLLGEPTWSDYEISTEVLLETNGFFAVFGRIEKDFEPTPFSYIVKFTTQPAQCELWRNKTLITSVPAAVFTNRWHQVRVQFEGALIEVVLDGVSLLRLTDATYATGLAGFGTGWHAAQFDNFSISQRHGTRNFVLDAVSAEASSTWMSHLHYAGKSIDGDLDTSWIAYDFTNQWLEITLPKARTVHRVVLWEPEERIGSWRLQAFQNDTWLDLVSGGKLVNRRAYAVPPTTSSRFRFYVDSGPGWPILSEFQLFDAGPSRLIWLNEWMLNNQGAVSNPVTGEFDSWFELFNPSATTVDLSGFFLSGSKTNSREFRIPDGVMLLPGEFLMVWADGRPDFTDIQARRLHTSVALRSGYPLALFDPNGELVDLVDLLPSAADTSYGSARDGSGPINLLQMPSPGKPNASLGRLEIRKNGPGTFSISVMGAPYARYTLQKSESLAAGDWTDVITVTADSTGGAGFISHSEPAQAVFLRVMETR